jgi:hypothetical protein
VPNVASSGNTSVFLSVGRTTTRRQEAFVRRIEEMLEEQELKSRTVGRSEFTNESPLNQVVATMRECRGIIVLAFERTYIKGGSEGAVISDNYFCRPCCLTSECYPTFSSRSHRGFGRCKARRGGGKDEAPSGHSSPFLHPLQRP